MSIPASASAARPPVMKTGSAAAGRASTGPCGQRHALALLDQRAVGTPGAHLRVVRLHRDHDVVVLARDPGQAISHLAARLAAHAAALAVEGRAAAAAHDVAQAARLAALVEV